MAACLAALLAGCGAAGGERARPTPQGVATGGSLRIGVSAPRSLDPATAQQPDELLIAGALCDTLVAQDPISGELVGGLAESWVVSDGGAHFVIKLRGGARFHDGSAVTVRDVVDSLNRLADPDFASPLAPLLAEVHGYAQYRGDVETDNRLARERLAGIKTASSNAISISLSAPNADFLAVLAHPATAPVAVAAAAADPDAFRRQPVCAGPYRVAQPWFGGEAAIVTRRFADYHGRNLAFTGGGAGYVDELLFAPVGEQADPRSRPFVTRPGQGPPPLPTLDGLDVVQVPSWRWRSVAGRGGREVVTALGPGIDYLGLPILGGSTDQTVERDVLAARQASLRRALSLAIDRTHIAEVVYGGARAPAVGLVPPSVDPGVGACPAAPLRADLDAANAALAASQVDLARESIDLVYNDEFTNGALVAAVADQWTRAFGVDVQLKAVEFDDLVTELGSAASSIDAFRMSWSVTHPSVDAWVHGLFHSGQSGRGNLAGFSNQDLDELLTDDARPETSDDDRRLLYSDALRLLCDQLPLIPVVQQQFGFAVATARVGSAVGTYAGGHLGQPLLRELHVQS